MLRKLALASGVLLVLFSAAIGAALVALPALLGVIAQREIANVTGRATSIGDVDLNLFTQHLVVSHVRVADRDGHPPLAELDRLDARFNLFALLHGTIEIHALALEAPVLRIRRDERGVLNVADILGRYLTKPGGEARRFRLGSFTVDRGHLVFADRAVTPARVWETKALTVAVSDVGSDLRDGKATVRFDLGPTTTLLEADGIAVHPVAAHFRLAIDGFDLDVFRPYLPRDATITVAGGRLGAKAEGRYGVTEGLRASGRTAVRDVSLVRRGDQGPLLAMPELALDARDVTWRDGVTAIARLEVTGTPRVFDRRVSPPRHVDVSPFRVVVESARFPANTPARLTLSAGVDGATLDAQGTVVPNPFTAELAMTLANGNLAFVRSWLPATLPATPDGGVLAATLTVRADRETTSVGGEFTVTDLVVGRAGQTAPLVRDPLVKGTVTNLTLQGGTVAAEALTLTGAPTIVDESRGVAQRFEIKTLAARVKDATWPGRGPATVEVDLALAAGGTTALRGTIHPGTLSVRMRADLADIDLMPFSGYLPADAAVAPGGGRVSGRLRVAHDRATGVRLNGRVRVADLALRRRGEAGSFVADKRVDLALRDAVVNNGAVTVREATLSGAPRIANVDLGRYTAQVRDLSWPAQRAARIALDATLAGGGSAALTGTLHPGTLDADAHVSFANLDLSRLAPWVSPDAPVTLGGGLVTGRAHLTHRSSAGVTVNGGATIHAFALLRRGYAPPFVTDPSLDVSVTDLVVKDGALRIRRAKVAGTPAVTDASARVPQRFEMSALAAVVEDVTWPATGPMRIHSTAALSEGGASKLEASLDPATLVAKGRATFLDVPLRYANGYLPPDLAVLPAGGRLQASFDIAHHRLTGVVIGGEGAVRDLALVRRGEKEPFLIDPRLSFAVTNLRIWDDTFAATRITAAGAPVLIDGTVVPARRIAIPGFTLTLDHARWPSDRPGTLTFDARLPDAGALVARGTADLGTRTVEAQVELRNAAVAPFNAYLPISTEARGVFDGTLAFRGVFTGELAATARGEIRARDVAIGPGPDVSIGLFDVHGIAFHWPDTLHIDTITIRQPSALLERATDGSFPLRAKLSPRPRGTAAHRVAVATPPGPRGETTPPSRPATDWLHFTIGRATVEEGDVRVLDRTTSPYYSEEITQLNVTLRDLTNVDDRQASLALQGVVGGHAALSLQGTAVPFADHRRLDVSGELRDFPVARTNPYLQKVVDWIARSGRLTTRVHYVINGDALNATNEIVVQRLDVAPGEGRSDRLVGLPLGLAVALLKDTRGDIRISLPVEGRLSSPHFDFGDAIGAVLRNTVARLVTAPFRAIGSIFRRDDGEPEVTVQPLAFPAGSAVLAPDASRQLQRVADFLRASPHIRIGLGVVVSREDLVALRAQRTAARVQRLQRDRKIDAFDTAARQLWTEVFPGQPYPKTTDEIVSAIAAASRQPDTATERLVTRRLAAVRQALIEATGIDPARIVPLEAPPSVGVPGAGRIEFKLLPS